MFEDIWNTILELTSKFVIPDWGSVIAMLPVLVFAGSVLIIAILFWKIWRQPKRQAGKVKIEPVPPPGVHMPGPSFAPPLAALGAFMLFLGLVFGGPLLIIGAIGLAVTLLYWLAEAVRIYDHDLGSTVTPLPEAEHDGPPAGVHMPGPSFLPFLAAVGLGMLFLGLVFGELATRGRRHRADPDPRRMDDGGTPGVREDRGGGPHRPPREHPRPAPAEGAPVRPRDHARRRVRHPDRLDPAAGIRRGGVGLARRVWSSRRTGRVR